VIRTAAEQAEKVRQAVFSTQQIERFRRFKIAGSNDPAPKLGIPRSTLELKIKQLNIKKYAFQ